MNREAEMRFAAERAKTMDMLCARIKHIETIHTACGRKRGAEDQRGRLIGGTKGGMNTKLHSVTDAEGRSIRFCMTAGQVGDHTGAAALQDGLAI